MKKFLCSILGAALALSCFSPISQAAVGTEPTVVFRDHSNDHPALNITEQAKEIGSLSVYKPVQRYNEGSKWTIEPVILKTNEAVKPGGIFYIYGDGMLQREMRIAIRPATDALPPETIPEDVRYIDPLQVDQETKFVAAKLPEDLKPGTYDVWICNKYGWSSAFRLNEAKPEWTDENEVAKGLKIGVYGKNLDAAEFGSKTNTKVALSDGTTAWEVPVISVNPFRVEFYIPDNLPNGEYSVHVSNNGGLVWSKNVALDQSLTVYDRVDDPLGLGVGWAREFKWDNVYNVRDFGAVGDGKADDLNAIQGAINKAHEDGGGVVYMPAGTYKIVGSIHMPGRVVLQGESREATTVLYSYPGEDKNSKQVIVAVGEGELEGRNGIARFTLKDDESVNQDWPDFYVWLGNGWNRMSETGGKTASYMFIKDFDLEYSLNRRGTGRAYGVNIIGDSHFIMDGCNFKGNVASMVFSAMQKYTKIDNNDFYTTFANLGNNGIYQTICNNYIQRFATDLHNGERLNTQGIFMRGPCYVSENYIENTGCPDENDGEVLCSENAGGGTKVTGYVTSATKNTVTFDTLKDPSAYDWDYSNPQWGIHYAMWIVSGRGMGQMAKVIDVDPQTRTFTLDRDFVIMPDSTSRIITNTISEGVIFYKNECYKAMKGYWFFGDVYNGVIADNIGRESEGAFLWALAVEGENCAVLYFNRITRNEFYGSSTTKNLCGIYTNLWVQGQPEPYTVVYGIEYRDNLIKDANKPFNEAVIDTNDYTESNDFNGMHITHNLVDQPTVTHTMQRAFLIEGNKVLNSSRGVGLGAEFNRREYMREYSARNLTSDIILRDNDLNTCEEPIAKRYASRVLFVE